MENFSFGTFLLGIMLMIISGLFIGYHRKIADSLGSGVSDYEKYKKWGLIALGVSFLVAINIHTAILTWLFHLIFRR